MHKISIASLFLSAALLPAQTAVNGQGTTLVASNNLASEPAIVASSDAPVATARRISTGVTAPKLVSGPQVHVSVTDFPSETVVGKNAVVAFRVDEKGIPQDVHVTKSVNQTVDSRILAAVREYRFTPAQLDGQDVAMDVNMNVNFEAR
jgi:TonB family protein